jgi:hypothetical protein
MLAVVALEPRDTPTHVTEFAAVLQGSARRILAT